MSATIELPKGGRPIATKLAKVMAAVHRVEKRGRNDFHKYDYATEGDVVEAVRNALAEQSVALLPSIDKVTFNPVGDGGKQYLVMVDITGTFVDGESGDSWPVKWAGMGADNSDKGIYKAVTGAMKYLLLKTFLIPTGDDPEATDEHGRPTQHHTRDANGNRANQPKFESKSQESQFRDAAQRGKKPAPTPAPKPADSVKEVDGEKVDTKTGEIIEGFDGQPNFEESTINEKQQKQLVAVARKAGWQDAQVKGYLQSLGINSSKEIKQGQELADLTSALEAGPAANNVGAA